MKALLALSALLFSVSSFADSLGGNAQLPPAIKIVNSAGKTLTYSTSQIASQKFAISGGNHFAMGATTRCDPRLGQTAEDVQIKLQIETYNGEPLTQEQLAAAPNLQTLTIAKGSNAYGRCQNETLDLTAITFQTANSDGSNAYNKVFKMEPTK